MTETPSPAPAGSKKPHEEECKQVIIRERPKVIFLYPLCIAAIIAGVWTMVEMNGGKPLAEVSMAPGRIFWWTFLINMVAMAFDFNRGSFLALILAFAAATLGIILLDQNFAIVEPIQLMLRHVVLIAHPHIYFMIAGGLALIFLGVWVVGWFDYWEITHNEILHHHGFMGDVKRYPAPSLQLHKEITDLFEYFLFVPFGGAGRIELIPAGSQRAVVLDNCIGVNPIEERTKKMLASLQVKVDTSGHGGE